MGKERTRIICMFLLLQLLGGTQTSYALAGKMHPINTRVLPKTSGRHDDSQDEKDGVGDDNTDFTTTPSGNPSSIPSSVPSSIPSSIPSAAPSSFPSQQPSHNPSSEPTETPQCTLDDSGEFSVTSDDVGEDGTGAVPVRYAYELVSSGGIVANLVGSIQSALGSIVLSSLFNGCPLVDGTDRRRILLSDAISESLTGFTSSPADEVDSFGCATNPQDGNQCTLVQGSFTLYTTSSDDTEISLLQEDAITSVRQSMEDTNSDLYVSDIVQISFIDLDTLSLLKNGAETQELKTNNDEGMDSGLLGGLVVSGLAVMVVLALVVKRRKSQVEVDETSNIDFDEFSIDDSGVDRNLDFGFDEKGNAVHHESNNRRNGNISAEVDDDKANIRLNRTIVDPTDFSDANCPGFCLTDIM